MTRLAFTRDIAPAIVNCELTHMERTPIDVERARAQHAEYERVLASLGCELERLPADPEMADCVFIEDTAVVLDHMAILSRPGAPSRRAEVPAVEQALMPYRQIGRIEAPATMDGGDVLVAGRRILVGVSSRTNAAAVKQIQVLAAPHGYSVEAVTVRGCLHLKSAVTAVGEGLFLANREWVPSGSLDGYDVVDVDPAEPDAANALRIGDVIVCADGFPRTRERLERRGLTVRVVDVSELAKAEGAVTCCSLIVDAVR